MRRTGVLAVVVGALVLGLAVGAQAQTVTGSIYGRVVDTTGAVIPGATITVTNTETNAKREAVTNEVGQYTVAFLPPSNYEVEVSLDGFKTHHEDGVLISAAQERSLVTVLTVGAMTELVTVESETPLLNTSSAEQNVQMSEEMVTELPMNRRDITQLLSAGPGLDAGGSNISINGSAPEGFTFSVDGVDAMPEVELPSLSQYGNFNYIKGVSVEAVKEVEVSKNIFSAEIGMTLSGNVNILTKSGTNNWHGSGFFNWQSDSLNSGDPVTDFVSPESYKGFGGSLGGPIIKDKLFFFGVYEGYRMQRDEAVNAYVPTAEFKNAVITAIPASKDYWDLWEDPTQAPDAGGSPIEARLQTTHFQERYDNHFVGRLDFNMSDTSFLNVRYVHARPYYLDPRTAIGNSREYDGKNDNLQANYTKILSPNLTSEWRFGWGNSGVNRVDQLWAANALTIEVPGVDDTDGEALIKDGKNWSLGTTWSWQKGAHALRFGGIYRYFSASRFNEEMPVWEYKDVPTLLQNRAEFVAFQLELAEFLLSNHDLGFFIQDDYRVNADLMLNLGLRWDYSGIPDERDDRLWNRDGRFGQLDQGASQPVYRASSSAWDANYSMFSPRVGFAYSMSERTVIRGGVGVFYIPFNMFSGPVEIVLNGSNTGPPSQPSPVEVELTAPQMDALGITYPTYNQEVADAAESPEASGDSGIANDRPNPRNYQWTLGVSQQLTNTVALDLAYVGNTGQKLTTSERINRPDRQTALFPVTGMSSPRFYHQVDETTYHALQMSLRKRFQNNLGFGAHYTYSSNTGLFANSLGCCDRTYNSQIEGNYSNNHSYVGTHTRHRLWADILWELPFGDSTFAEGWLVGAVFQARSGQPIEVRDRGGNGYRWSRPDYLAGSPSDAVIDTELSSDPPVWQYLDPTLFSRVDRTDVNIQERPGTSARAPYIGPGGWSFDLSLSKSFRFGRGSRVQFRWDLFNAFNHANRDDPRDRIDNSRFGQIDDIDGYRTMQLGVRFDF